MSWNCLCDSINNVMDKNCGWSSALWESDTRTALHTCSVLASVRTAERGAGNVWSIVSSPSARANYGIIRKRRISTGFHRWRNRWWNPGAELVSQDVATSARPFRRQSDPGRRSATARGKLKLAHRRKKKTSTNYRTDTYQYLAAFSLPRTSTRNHSHMFLFFLNFICFD